ncbi:MAG: hypothetical protein ACXAC6_10625 [Candidatus Hodarchaeales archaeon]|jgi:hypothetical protein
MVFNLHKTHSLIEFSIILLFLFNSTSVLPGIENLESFGVNIGDKFNLLVTDLPERPSFSQGGDPPAGVNFTQLFNLNLDNFTLRPVINPLPVVGAAISLNITSLPNNSSPGIIRYNISQNYTNLAFNFVLGEPVVSNNWESWIEVINTMEEKKVIDDKTITIIRLELNDTYFTSVLSFKPKIPDSIKFMVSSFEIKQTLRYFVISGIRDLIKVETSVSVLFFGTYVSTTSLEYISDSYTMIERLTSSSSTSPPDLFQILLIPVIIFVPVAFIIYFIRKNKSLLPKK